MFKSISSNYIIKNVCVGGGGFISGIVFHPKIKDLIYIRTDMGGVYKREKKDTNWICITDMFSKDESFYNGALSIAFDEKNNGKIYLLCGKYTDNNSPYGRIYISDNYGYTFKWYQIPFKVGSNEAGRGMDERLVVCPEHPNILFAGSTYCGLWKSIDYGKNWKKVKSFPEEDINFLLFDKNLKKRLIVASASGNIYFSENNGLKWIKISNTLTGLAYRACVSNDNKIYFTFNDSKGPWGIKNGGVWKLDLHSFEWQRLNIPEDNGGFGGIAIFQNNEILVSTICRDENDEIYFSDNGGKNFKPILKNSVWKSFAPYTKTINPHWISDIKINPFNHKNVLFVTGYGIWETYNIFEKKVTWYFNNQGIEETVPMQIISPYKGVHLISAMGDIDGFVHSNLNKSPKKRHTPFKKTTLAIDYAGLKPKILVKAYNSAKPYGSYSINGAERWIDFKSFPYKAKAGGVKSIAISADGKSMVWCPVGADVSYSKDNGNKWIKSKGNVPSGYWIISDKVNPGVFYIYEAIKGFLWKSEDYGESFYIINSKLPKNKEKPKGDGMVDYEINCIYNKKDNIWLAAGAAGLFYSIDGGKKFNKIQTVNKAYRVGFGKNAKGCNYPVIFIWANIRNRTGIFMSQDMGKRWFRINDERHQFGWIHCITGDPRIFGRCYFSTEGRGIMYGEKK